ncbi:MAG: HEAT repeat domain-containing protein [Planctomycetota bacterium]
MILPRLAAVGLLLLPPSLLASTVEAAAAPMAPSTQEEGKKKDRDEDEGQRAKRDAEAKAAAEAIRKGLSAQEVNARRAALLESSEIVHPTVIAEVAKALGDESVEVRRTAIEVLGLMRHGDARKALEGYARKEKRALAKDVETSVALYRSIGRQRSASSVKALLKRALEEESYEVRRARVWAAAYQRSPEALEGILYAMKKSDTRRLRGRMRELRPALVHLTGTDQGADPARWLAWWSENRKTFEVPTEPPKIPGDMGTQWRRFWGEERQYERRKKRGDRG